MLVTFRSEQQTASYQPGIIRKAIATCYLFVGREAAYLSGRGVSLDAGAGLYDHADQWRLTFEKSAMGAAVINSAFRFLMVNPAFLTMVGYSSEELQQLSLLDICVDGEGDEHRVPLRELREGVESSV